MERAVLTWQLWFKVAFCHHTHILFLVHVPAVPAFLAQISYAVEFLEPLFPLGIYTVDGRRILAYLCTVRTQVMVVIGPPAEPVFRVVARVFLRASAYFTYSVHIL